MSVAYKWESEEQGNCFYFFPNSFDKVICPNLFKCCRFTRSNQGIVGSVRNGGTTLLFRGNIVAI